MTRFPYESTAWKRIFRPILVIENAYLITGYQGSDESVKMYWYLGQSILMCLLLQWCFHRIELLRTKGWLLYTDENALDRENEDGSVTEENWRSTGANFLVNIPMNKSATMHKNRQRRSKIHLLIIFMDPGVFYDNGMYYCKQNRNNIGQTSNFIHVFFSSHTIVESVWTQRNFDTHITSQILS